MLTKHLILVTAAIILVGCSTNNHSYFQATKASTVQTAQVQKPNVNHNKQFFSELENGGSQVVQQNNNVKVIMPVSTNFSISGTQINTTFKEQLDIIANILEENPYMVVEITGNTDNTGTENSNIALSEKRAHAVVSYLETRGIPSNRLLPVGLGGNHPIADNNTEEGRIYNRRVEITLHDGSSHLDKSA